MLCMLCLYKVGQISIVSDFVSVFPAEETLLSSPGKYLEGKQTTVVATLHHFWFLRVLIRGHCFDFGIGPVDLWVLL